MKKEQKKKEEDKEEKEEKVYYTSKCDGVFKAIFCNENDLSLLKALLEDKLNIKIETMKLLNNELVIDYVGDKIKHVDAIVEVNDKMIVNIEVNGYYAGWRAFRNFVYFCQIIVSRIVNGQSYDLKNEFVQINLTYGLSKKKEIVRNIEYSENVKMLEFNMDKIRDLWYYNDEEEIEKYKYLIMQDLDKEQLDKFCEKFKGDDVIMTYREKLNKLNDGGYHFLTPEEEELYERNTYKEMGRDEGLKEGLEQGRVEGKEEGRKEEKEETARNMLKDKVDVALISKYTNLPTSRIMTLL